MPVSFQTLWDNHPGRAQPCNGTLFKNQCAIRIGVCLEKSLISLHSFNGERCWESHPNKERHILRAKELAVWLDNNVVLGETKKYIRKNEKQLNRSTFKGRKGVIFILHGFSDGMSHIDIWDGNVLKGTETENITTYLSTGEEIWFWELK